MCQTLQCDECNDFVVHSCDEGINTKYDPNKENAISYEFWFDGEDWWGELIDRHHVPTFINSAYHFKVKFCPFCNINLKDIKKV